MPSIFATVGNQSGRLVNGWQYIPVEKFNPIYWLNKLDEKIYFDESKKRLETLHLTALNR